MYGCASRPGSVPRSACAWWLNDAPVNIIQRVQARHCRPPVRPSVRCRTNGIDIVGECGLGGLADATFAAAFSHEPRGAAADAPRH